MLFIRKRETFIWKWLCVCVLMMLLFILMPMHRFILCIWFSVWDAVLFDGLASLFFLVVWHLNDASPCNFLFVRMFLKMVLCVPSRHCLHRRRQWSYTFEQNQTTKTSTITGWKSMSYFCRWPTLVMWFFLLHSSE